MTPAKKTPIKEVVPEEPQEQLYVLKRTKVDSFNTLATYVPLAGDMCPICGFSVCETNHLPEYSALDDSQRARVDGTLKSHLAKHLPTDRPSTISESQLPKEWVSKATKVS